MNRRLGNLAAVLVGLALLALAEGMLALLGVIPLAAEDPFVGFEGSSELFVPAAGLPGTYTLNPAKERYFNEQSFAVPKAPGTFRLVAFGGSTTYGRPYLARTAFPEWMARLLERAVPGTGVEAVNAGGISYASYRVIRLVRELARFEPDLYVVYAGHNEFLETRTFAAILEESPRRRALRALLHRSRIYSLLSRRLRRVVGTGPGRAGERTVLGEEVDARLEEIGGPQLYHRDEVFRRGVILHYRRSLREIARFARARGIPLVLCTLPVNLSGVSPFKSEHREGLDAAALAAWEADFARGERLLADGQPLPALEALRLAERIDDRYALLHYRIGQACEAAGRFEEAYGAYDRAREEDVVPLRALGVFNEAIREIAAEEGVALADVERVFRALSPHGIPGPSLFVDHVHPTIEGQQLIAFVALDAAARAGMLPLPAERWLRQAPGARAYLRSEAARVPPRYRAMGVWGVGRLYYWAGKYPEAYAALSSAWEQIRDKPEIPAELGQIELTRGRPREALGYFRAALALDPEGTTSALGEADAKLMLGEADAALGILSGRSWPAKVLPAVEYTRGRALLESGRPAEALVALRRAVELAPEVASLRQALADALRRAGLVEEAEREEGEYRRLSRAGGDGGEARR